MEHKPVMLTESLEGLAVRKDGIYVDATFGRGGHSKAILGVLGQSGSLLAIDRDIEAINSPMALELLKDPRFELKQGCFSSLSAILREKEWLGCVDGILLDLGVSSPQLDDASRGFSFMQNGPLDMRMSSEEGLSAADWLAQISEKELVKVLFEYGEERFARQIARKIVEARALAPIVTTAQLVEIIEEAQPWRDRFKHPATRSFQAIRIAVNKELEELESVLGQSLQILKTGGRLVVISFHSLEDRVVKRFMREESGVKHDPGKLPVKQAELARGGFQKARKPIKAAADEIKQNPRARSAVMRVAERV